MTDYEPPAAELVVGERHEPSETYVIADDGLLGTAMNGYIKRLAELSHLEVGLCVLCMAGDDRCYDATTSREMYEHIETSHPRAAMILDRAWSSRPDSQH